MKMTIAEVCARAHKYERENMRMHWIMVCLAPLFIILVLYRLYSVLFWHNYLLAATLSWVFLSFSYVAWNFFRNGPKRMGASEPCAQFLKREFEGRRHAAHAMGQWVLTLVPVVFAAWWAGGPAIGAKQLGIKSDWLLQVHGPVPLIVTLALLAMIWLAMQDMARKAGREIEKIGDH